MIEALLSDWGRYALASACGWREPRVRRASRVAYHPAAPKLGRNKFAQNPECLFRLIAEHAVARVRESLEAHQVWRNCSCQLFHIGDSTDGIEFTGQNERRAGNATQLRKQVHDPLLAAYPFRTHFKIKRCPQPRVRIRQRSPRIVERHTNARVLAEVFARWIVPEPLRHFGRMGASQFAEHSESPLRPSFCEGARQYQLRRMI